MLTPLSIEGSKRLFDGFQAAGYSYTGLQGHLGAVELPSPTLRNEPRLLDRTREPTLLNALLRWFWLGRPLSVEFARRSVPNSLLRPLLDSGLLRQNGDLFAPEAMLLPVDIFLVAADHPSSFERGETDLVLWPNPTSKFLGRFAVKRRSRSTLDLGTGSGILSLWAASHSDGVVATDLNPRAASFVRFNARLNGIVNIETVTGQSFAPIQGRSFDLILANPPFFIRPGSDYLFCDNPMDLDRFCRQLVQQAPGYLNEDGYLQILCEWAQVAGQPWEERIAEWLKGTGCDAWVMEGLTQAPDEYAQHRIRETTNDSAHDSALYDRYMAYYRERGVEAIHDGLIVMRKRSGDNWIRIEEVPKTPTGDLGELVLSTFAAHDFLREVESEERLLAVRLKLADDVRLEQVCDQLHDQWRSESLTLRLTSGFPFHMQVQPLVAEFLVNCDGERTVLQAIETFAAAAKAPIDTIQRECVAILRKLIERGFLVPYKSAR